MNLRSLPHQGGGGAFHGDAAGGSQVGHGDVVLHRDLSLLASRARGSTTRGSASQARNTLQARPSFSARRTCLAPTTLLTLLSSDTISVPSSPPAKAGVVSLGKGRKAPLSPQFQIITDCQAPVKHKSTRIPQSFPPCPSGFRKKQETGLFSPPPGRFSGP